MKKRNPTAGKRMIESARQSLAFAKGEENHGCEVHVPEDTPATVTPHTPKTLSSETAAYLLSST